MILTKFNKEVQNISLLSDYPNSNDGLTSSELKEKFDQAGVDLKEFINDTLTSELDSIHANYEETLATKDEVDENYLKKTDAEETYLTINDASDTYLTQANANSDYLKKNDASATYLTKTDAQNTYDTISNVSTTYATKQALAEAQMGAIVDQSVTLQKLAPEVQAILNNADTNIDDIVSKIPSEASSVNKLADKSWVNGRVQENTANFIGRFDSVEELEAYSGTLTNNDYAYVVTQELDGTEKIVRYRYVASTTSWEEEFDMNNTIFTQSQLDTINSGLTASDTGKYVNKYNIPTVEKVIDQEKIVYTNNILSTNPNDFTQITNKEYSGSMQAYGEIGTCKLYSCEPYVDGNLVDKIVSENGDEYFLSSAVMEKYVTIEYSIPIMATKFKIYATNNNVPFLIKGSNDNINWDILYNNVLPSYITETTISQPKKYKYYRLQSSSSSTGGSYKLKVYHFSISEYVNILETTYQNQFTLDNNTSFTNNQRVLIETPNVPQIILSNPQKLEEKTWQLNDTNTILTSNDNITITTNREKSDFVNFIDGDTSTRYTFTTPKTESTNVIIDLLTDKAISSLQLYIKNVADYANKLYYSSNGTTWKEFYNYSSQQAGTNWTETINDTLIARYIKIESTNNSTSETVTSFYEIKCTINDYTIIGGMTLDSVESNTLNGIEIPTLLQPSTKYELIYNETTNKFNLGKLSDNTLFDITLTESVTQIQIDGLFDKFKTNVLYMCIVNGGANNNNNIYMGKNDTTGINLPTISSTTTPYNYVSFFSFSKKESNIVSWDSIYSNGSNYVSAHNNLSNPEDIIAIYGSSFIAGTHIIIKEVA